jgi:hypothetical protein
VFSRVICICVICERKGAFGYRLKSIRVCLFIPILVRVYTYSSVRIVLYYILVLVS